MLECKTVWHSIELVWKVQEAINNGYWLVTIIKKICINRDFYILVGFDCFDIGVTIYLCRHSLMLVVGTASVILMDGAKQAGLVVVISQSHI